MPINIVLYRHKRVDDRCHYYEQPRITEQSILKTTIGQMMASMKS